MAYAVKRRVIVTCFSSNVFDNLVIKTIKDSAKHNGSNDINVGSMKIKKS